MKRPYLLDENVTLKFPTGMKLSGPTEPQKLNIKVIREAAKNKKKIQY